MKKVFMTIFLTSFAANCYADLSIAVGEFNNGSVTQPLLAMSNDEGITWSYPKEIYNNTMTSGGLHGATCHEKICVVTGYYANGVNYPLIGVSADQGTTWVYPESIYSKAFPVFLDSGTLNAVSCTNTTCVASGAAVKFNTTMNSNLFRPLLAVSKNNGKEWVYPKNIYASALPNNFIEGEFDSVSCDEKFCVAAGQYTSNIEIKTYTLPLIAMSQDEGATWSYSKTADSLSSLPSTLSSKAELDAVSCSGKLCIASGNFFDKTIVVNRVIERMHPLIAMSKDSGSTWSYPEAIYANALPSGFKEGWLRTASCSGKLCIASGYYYTQTSNALRPLLAMTQDGGDTWFYPQAIYTNALPANFTSGTLNGGAYCKGKVCIAVGYYRDDERTRPLLVMSQDSGATWTYPTTIFSSQNLPINFTQGELSSIKCKDKFCVASGMYSDGKHHLPLLAISKDEGITWSYPKEIYGNTLPYSLVDGNLDGGSAVS